MGCASSTQVVTDMNGNEKQKKKLGGAYPGQRRPQHQAYTPPASDFGKEGQATAHFVAHGGGNALVLVKKDGSAQPESGGVGAGGKPQYISVTLPAGVEPGQTIHVQAPDGSVNAIVIPPGFGPGSTFTVEFAPQVVEPVTAVPLEEKYASYSNSNTASSVPVSGPPPPPVAPSAPAGDDGFASGFNNPNWRPTGTPTAQAVPYSGSGGNYPTTTATRY